MWIEVNSSVNSYIRHFHCPFSSATIIAREKITNYTWENILYVWRIWPKITCCQDKVKDVVGKEISASGMSTTLSSQALINPHHAFQEILFRFLRNIRCNLKKYYLQFKNKKCRTLACLAHFLSQALINPNPVPPPYHVDKKCGSNFNMKCRNN